MVRVLIVDDSAIVRSVLEEELSEYDDIDVLGTAPDPFVARNKILKLKPDVITLDIEMPRMDGLTFLKKLMTYYPIPIVIVSSVTADDAKASIRALELGAFDVVNKPSGAISIKEAVEEIHEKLLNAWQVKDSFLTRRKLVLSKLRPKAVSVKEGYLRALKTSDTIIGIGSSTGGTVALEYIFKALPANCPPILVVQHMPPLYTAQFAKRLNEISALTVKESEDGEPVRQGTAYIGKGGYHLKVRRRGAALYLVHTEEEKVRYQRPSADVLFFSMAEVVGRNAAGFILTGMGRDGAEGLLSMKRAGAWTVAQDEESCIVWGMPRAAVELEAHQAVASLNDIPQRIIDYSAGKP